MYLLVLFELYLICIPFFILLILSNIFIFFCYNYSHPNNSLRSNNSSEKENNNSYIESNINSNYNSNNITNNTHTKNSKKVYNSIINAGNNWKYKKNKQLTQKNKNINMSN